MFELIIEDNFTPFKHVVCKVCWESASLDENWFPGWGLDYHMRRYKCRCGNSFYYVKGASSQSGGSIPLPDF